MRDGSSEIPDDTPHTTQVVGDGVQMTTQVGLFKKS